MNEQDNTMPVYLFLGFLEGGKTKFIQQTLGEDNFNNGDRTLLLVCEEGIEEYDDTDFERDNIFMRTIEDLSELEPERLSELAEEVAAQRVVIEYNGMWMMNDLFNALPEGWMIYQILFFADATTFLQYNQNMRSLVVDKLNMCELVVFNRFDKNTMDMNEFHKIVRGVSRRTQIAYEYTDGTAEYDNIEDPLPFDVEAQHIYVEDRDYALWYRDINEEPEKYDGKTVTFKVSALSDPQFPKGIIALGRQIMTCCVEDISFCWLVTKYDGAIDFRKPKWVNATVDVKYRNHRMYRGRGPVLYVKEISETEPPEQIVATFY